MSEESSQLPPPVPADADLRHFPDMPLDVARLRDGWFAGEADAEVFRCALLLLCVAWHQLPAGSLPADDVSLARLAGLGRDLRGWRRIKDRVLRGFRQFADGRLYHPLLCAKVIYGWDKTLVHGWQKTCDRIRKENGERRKEGRLALPLPPKPAPCALAWPSEFRPPSDGNPAAAPAACGGIPAEAGLKEKKGKRLSSASEIDAVSAREAKARVEPRLARSKAYQDMTAELARLAARRREVLDADAA